MNDHTGVNTVQSQIIRVIAEKSGCAAGVINLDSDIREDIGMDSLDLLELQLSLEVEFNINIPDEDWPMPTDPMSDSSGARDITVQNVIDAVQKALRQSELKALFPPPPRN
jgi:acyl carrier protein